MVIIVVDVICLFRFYLNLSNNDEGTTFTLETQRVTLGSGLCTSNFNNYAALF